MKTTLSIIKAGGKLALEGAAVLPYSGLEYGGIVRKMEKLEPGFKVKG
jgi:hypothetical protein